MITHANDAVGHFGLDLLVRAPDWLGPAGPRGHDYRADLARFVREVYGLKASDDQLATVEAALRVSELEHKHLLDAAKTRKSG
jgi:uncharacterized membrane protein